MVSSEKEMAASCGVEWRINMPDGSSEILTPEKGLVGRVIFGIKCMVLGLVWKIWDFLKKAWDLAIDDPKKVIHCLKVGIALTVVSLFYYMRPLYEGVGRNAMWAVMTVVVVFESTVGATIYKSLNRVTGTFLAGALALGIHWIASQSGEKFEPIIMGASIFLLASATTFSRFIPSVKARFDYGALIFILTFSLVSVSGYRVEKLLTMAYHRLSTIIIGTSFCIFISMLVCPVWAGEKLHLLAAQNLDKLANSLQACVALYFNDDNDDMAIDHKNLQGYKCVLNSKATEDSMANFARWEPAHGRFNFQHPWRQYLKIGASIRRCACCVEALNTCLSSENQAPEHLKKQLSNICLRVGSSCSSATKELAMTLKTMKKSAKTEFSIEELRSSVKDLQKELKSLPQSLVNQLHTAKAQQSAENEQKERVSTSTAVSLVEIIPLASFASLLIEVSVRIEGIAFAVDELAKLADFKSAEDEKIKQIQPIKIQPTQQ
ncbi:Aluminum-activated malate transporter [Dillenia turbinata]|uniref:Aluminum-activated malate transporter n=1 Tax=Dillenia turbinata TaxID=194707 RepID=A0AAN8ZIT9_9MAGN